MSGLKSRAHLIRKYTYPTSLISSSLTQLGALYVQKRFFPTWRRSSTQPAQVSIAAVSFAPISSWMCKFDISFFVITFLASMWAHFCDAFLIRFSDSRHGIILTFAGTVFSRSQLLKATDAIFSRHTAFVCVGATPVPKGFYHTSHFLVTAPTFYKQGGRAFLSLHFSQYISCLYVGSFLQCLPGSFLRLSPWNHFEVRGNSFFKITVAESNGWYIFATYGLCVWGQPLFRRAFITCPIFSYSSQFTSRGTRHPWLTVCNEATVLDGISGLITLTYLQLVMMFSHYSSLLMHFRTVFGHMHE